MNSPGKSDGLRVRRDSNGLLSRIASFVRRVFNLDSLVSQGNSIAQLRTAVEMRLPRPFLGDGFNNDWAEMKIREIASSSETKPVLNFGSNKANDGQTIQPSDKVSGSAAYTSRRILAHELADEAEIEHGEISLLREWLNNSTHSEDRWVEDFLSRARNGSSS